MEPPARVWARCRAPIPHAGRLGRWRARAPAPRRSRRRLRRPTARPRRTAPAAYTHDDQPFDVSYDGPGRDVSGRPPGKSPLSYSSSGLSATPHPPVDHRIHRHDGHPKRHLTLTGKTGRIQRAQHIPLEKIFRIPARAGELPQPVLQRRQWTDRALATRSQRPRRQPGRGPSPLVPSALPPGHPARRTGRRRRARRRPRSRGFPTPRRRHSLTRRAERSPAP